MTHDEFVEKINDWLDINFPGVSTSTDLLEHALLLHLGCKFIPDRSLFGAHASFNEYRNVLQRIIISLETPINMDTKEFQDHLKDCIKDTLPLIELVVNCDENLNKSMSANFTTQLLIPFESLNALLPHIFSAMKKILDKKFKFYKFWDQYCLEVHDTALTLVFLEENIQRFLLESPLSSKDEIWNSIITKAVKSEKKLTIIKQHAYNDVEKWPLIRFDCHDENGTEQQIELSRDVLLTVMNTEFTDIKKDLLANKELLIPDNMNKYARKILGNQQFYMNEEERYCIDLAYHQNFAEKLLAQYKIEFKKLELTEGDLPERGVKIYIFDAHNYINYCLALKEIHGHACIKERIMQLKYYCREKKWVDLEHTLLFLINMDRVDYADLVFELFEHAKDNYLSDLLHTVEDALHCIANNKKNRFSTEQIKKANSQLVEVKIILMNAIPLNAFLSCEEKEEYLNECKKEHFISAHKAEDFVLFERLLMERCGKSLSDKNTNYSVKNPLVICMELAEEVKKLSDENKQLSEKIKQLEDKGLVRSITDYPPTNHSIFQPAQQKPSSSSSLAQSKKACP